MSVRISEMLISLYLRKGSSITTVTLHFVKPLAMDAISVNFLCVSFLKTAKELRLNFDENMDAIQTQITWKYHYGCLFTLRQEALKRNGEFFDLWVEIFTEEGKTTCYLCKKSER